MKNKLRLVSNRDLLVELEKRLTPLLETPPSVPVFKDQHALPVIHKHITPYEIMLEMIKNDWSENPATGVSDPRIDKMWQYLGFLQHTDDQSYCAATVNACLKLAGYECSDSIPIALSFTTYGKMITSMATVTEGDLAVLERLDSSWQGHVGFVTSITEDHVLISGGNQNNRMCTKMYPIVSDTYRVKCFRRITDVNRTREPDYDTLKKWGLYRGE